MLGTQSDVGRNTDPRARYEEKPPHAVALAPFLVGKHEMTQGQYG
jgi:formylglycine-generating enzyme required for sulfatase activity